MTMPPQDFNLLRERLLSELGKDKIETILDELRDSPFIRGEKYDMCIQLHGRLVALNKKYINGIAHDDDSRRERNRIRKDVLTFIRGIDFKNVSSVLNTTIDDLQKKIRVIAEAHGIEPVYDVLKQILKVNDLRNGINEIEGRYSENVWRLKNGKYNSLEEWEKVHEELEDKIESVIGKLKDKYLEDDWATTFSEIDLGIIPNKVSILFALFSKIDDIKFPEKMEKEVTFTTSITKTDEGKIIEEKITGLVSDEEKRCFKRLMFLYQDAYQAGDYELACRYCTQVREEIEPESAYLYQALMLSYFKLLNGSEPGIIKEVIDGKKEQEFKNLLVYAHRLSSITQKEGNIQKTAEYNIEEMVSGLMVNLKDEYSQIEYDYIVCPAKDLGKEKRDKVKKCIKTATEITRFIETKVLFAEIVVNELIGGGKFKWLKVNEKQELVNCTDEPKFNAYTTLKNAQTLIKHYSKIEDDGLVEEILIKNLLKSLGEKYRKLIGVSKKKNKEYITYISNPLINFELISQE